jgi:hypothetical protein
MSASVRPPPPIRVARSEESVLLSRAPASIDSSRCTSFAVHNVAVKRTLFELYGCDADPPRHAFFAAGRAFPG